MPELITLRDEDLQGDEPQEYFFFDKPPQIPLQRYYDLQTLMQLAQLQQGLPQIVLGQPQIFPQEGTLTGIGQTYTFTTQTGDPIGGLLHGLTGGFSGKNF